MLLVGIFLHCRHRRQLHQILDMWSESLAFCLVKYTPCPQKTKQICFCQNCVKFPPILIIFGRKMAKGHTSTISS